MSRSTAVVILLVLFGFLRSAKAQEIETPKVELYGGYDYVRYNANPRINGVPLSESFSANGISGQATYNAKSRFGIGYSSYRVTSEYPSSYKNLIVVTDATPQYE